MTIQELCDIEAQDLAKELGYSFERKWLKLSQYTGELDRSPQTQERIEEVLPHVSLISDRAKREIFVSPMISDLIHYTKANMRIECPIQVTEQLEVVLDYFIKSDLINDTLRNFDVLMRILIQATTTKNQPNLKQEENDDD